MVKSFTLIEIYNFVKESNFIEGIEREPSDPEVVSLERFLSRDRAVVEDMVLLQSVFQPNAQPRFSPSVPGVRVGKHVAPLSGPFILDMLTFYCTEATQDTMHPFVLHNAYEALHPFTDGNGRTGRALWAWQMCHYYDKYQFGIGLGFFHAWYYQSLQIGR